jgi:hypothetical protein
VTAESSDPARPLNDRVRHGLADARDRIRRAGGSDDLAVLAVTKGFGVDHVRAALACDLTEVGENYAQELMAKRAALSEEPQPRWHFIGRLQRNKVRVLAPVVALWQSVDRPPLVREIARRAPGASILIQVDVAGEEQKGGCPPDEVAGLVRVARDEGLDVRGIMCVGPSGPPERARLPFRRAVALADELGLAERSLGMSADLEVAVEEGSTLLRLGRTLFGDRPPA